MLAETLAVWADRVPSQLSHHDRSCCESARAWFRAMALSRQASESEPAWISRRYRWGPSPWPLSWCEAVTREALDCGAMMALAIVSFRLRGKLAVPVQLVELVPPNWSGNFRATWEAAGLSPDWIRGDLVYHEACGILDAGQVFLWDPTDSSWRVPSAAGPLRVVAVRLCEVDGVTLTGRMLWSGLGIRPGPWTTLRSATEEAKI